jgi:hypothetical protein
MADADFTIDKVEWHTSTPGNLEPRELTVRRLFAVASFLQSHGLTRRPLVGGIEEVTDAFAIESRDLTDRGLELMRQAYDKWVRKVDRGMDPEDLSLFEKTLRGL